MKKSVISEGLLSRTPLTRSNPYFEAELVETKVLTDDGNVDSINVVDPSEDSDDDVDDDGETKSGVLIGCLFNKLLVVLWCLLCLDVQLPMLSVPITTQVVNLNLDQDEVYWLPV
jgi:hypothetical protein